MDKNIKKILSCGLVLNSALIGSIPANATESISLKSWEDDNLETKKESAINSLNDYVDLSDYRTTQQNEIKSIISDYTSKINSASSGSAIETYLSSAKKAIDKKKTAAQLDAEDYEKEQEEQAKALASAKKEAEKSVKNTVVKSSYRAEEQSQIDSIINEATNDINNAGSIEEINSIVSNAKTRLLNLKTKAEYVKEESEAAQAALTEKKTAAKQELANYKNKADYRNEGKNQIDTLLTQASERIDNASTANDIDNLVSNYKTKLDKIKTDANLSESEKAESEKNAEKTLSAQKASAKSQLSKLLKLSDYDDETIAKMEKTLSDARKKVDEATSVSELDKIVEDTRTDLNAIVKDIKYTTNTTTPSSSAFDTTTQTTQSTTQVTSQTTQNTTTTTQTTVNSQTTTETTKTQNTNETTVSATTETTKPTLKDDKAGAVSTSDTTPVKNKTSAIATIFGIATALLSGVILTRKKEEK